MQNIRMSSKIRHRTFTEDENIKEGVRSIQNLMTVIRKIGLVMHYPHAMTPMEIAAVALLTSVYCEWVFGRMQWVISSSRSRILQTRKQQLVFLQVVRSLQRSLCRHPGFYKNIVTVFFKKDLIASWFPFFTPQEISGGLNAPTGFHKCHSTLFFAHRSWFRELFLVFRQCVKFWFNLVKFLSQIPVYRCPFCLDMRHVTEVTFSVIGQNTNQALLWKERCSRIHHDSHVFWQLSDMTTLKVFADFTSQPSRSVLLLLKANDIPFTVQVIQIAKGLGRLLHVFQISSKCNIMAAVLRQYFTKN